MKIDRIFSFCTSLLAITLLISCGNISSENISSEKEELTVNNFFRYVKDQNKKLLLDGSIAADQNIFNSEYEANGRWDFTSIDKNTGFRGEMYGINNAYSNLYGYTSSQAKKNIAMEAEEWTSILSEGIDDILDQIILEKQAEEFYGGDDPEPAWAVAEKEIRDIEITLLQSAKGKSLKDLNLYQWCCLLERNPVEFSTNCDLLSEHPHPFEYASTMGIPDRIALLEEDHPELIANLEDSYNDFDYDRDYSPSNCEEVRAVLQRNRVKQDRLISIYGKVISDGIQSISDADLTYWNCGEESDEVGAFSSYSTIQFYNGENHDLYSCKYYAEPDTSTNKIIRGSYFEWNDIYNDIDSGIENGEAESVQDLYDMLNTNDKFMMFVIDDSNKKKFQMVWKWPETNQYSNRSLLYEFPINDQQASFFEDTWRNLLNKSDSTE